MEDILSSHGITGGNCMILKREANETVWDKTRLVRKSLKAVFSRSSVFYRAASDPEFKKKTEDQVFDILRAYAKARCLLGASVNKRDDEKVEKRDSSVFYSRMSSTGDAWTRCTTKAKRESNSSNCKTRGATSTNGKAPGPTVPKNGQKIQPLRRN